MAINKEQLLLKECVYPHHKLFKKIEILDHFKKFPLTLEGMAQKLTEEAMAHASAGKLKWNDGDLEDYDDSSDQKTGTMRPQTNYGTGSGYIGGLSTPSGSQKNGAIRAIIHNQFTNRLDYFYFPKQVWLLHSDKSQGILRMRFSYSAKKDKYVAWAEEYRVSSFKELSNITKQNFREKLGLGKR